MIDSIAVDAMRHFYRVDANDRVRISKTHRSSNMHESTTTDRGNVVWCVPDVGLHRGRTRFSKD